MAQNRDSVLVVYKHKTTGALFARDRAWSEIDELDDIEHPVVLISVFKENPDPEQSPFRDNYSGHSCYAVQMRGPNIRVTQCDDSGGGVLARDIDTTPGLQGGNLKTRDWPTKLNQAAVAGGVTFLDANPSTQELNTALAMTPDDAT